MVVGPETGSSFNCWKVTEPTSCSKCGVFFFFFLHGNQKIIGVGGELCWWLWLMAAPFEAIRASKKIRKKMQTEEERVKRR
jgi:hypothetical protein